jgi:hypothetical protein
MKDDDIVDVSVYDSGSRGAGSGNRRRVVAAAVGMAVRKR